MSRETDLKLAKMAARLKLTLMRDNMEFMLRTVSEAKMTPRETLEYFFSKEIEQRESNRVKLALMAAHFPRICTLEVCLAIKKSPVWPIRIPQFGH
jgi:hypothetical protein